MIMKPISGRGQYDTHPKPDFFYGLELSVKLQFHYVLPSLINELRVSGKKSHPENER